MISILLIISMTFFSCAVQSPPTGGNRDITGPEVKNIKPPNGTTNINSSESIEITFNEMIDSKTIKSSISVFPYTDIKINSFNNKIVLKPKKNWPKNQLFKINISRYISDYHGNNMIEGKTYTFSESDTVPKGSIIGQLFNYDKSISRINLYEVKTDNLSFICSIENNDQGEFQFNNILNGDYILIGIVDSFNDISQNIRKNKFSISNKIIKVKNDRHICNLNFNVPIIRKYIKSSSMQNKNYGLIEFNDGVRINLINQFLKDEDFKESDNIIYFNPDDTFISIKLKNNIEYYSIDEAIDFSIFPDDKYDVSISESIFDMGNVYIKFSEPIQIIDYEKYIFTYLSDDSLHINVKYEFIDPMTIKLFSVPDSINVINIENNFIYDFSDNKNNLIDSLVSINSQSHYMDRKDGGNLFGKIIYEGNNKIIVEAVNINTKETIRVNPDKYGNYKFYNLEVGEYQVWAYEHLNPINNSYFNGTMEPLKLAAKFGYYNSNIETRSKWDIEDIRIKIK